jgi:antitoxin component of RelBE/YafQ-DinJ toxin-antitoxin module
LHYLAFCLWFASLTGRLLPYGRPLPRRRFTAGKADRLAIAIQELLETEANNVTPRKPRLLAYSFQDLVLLRIDPGIHPMLLRVHLGAQVIPSYPARARKKLLFFSTGAFWEEMGQQSGKEIRVNVRVDADLKRRLTDLCEKQRISETEVVRQCLEAAVNHFHQHGRLIFPIEIQPADIEGTMEYLAKLRKDKEDEIGGVDFDPQQPGKRAAEPRTRYSSRKRASNE